MLGETATWKESSVGEVDLRSDPHASQESVAAVLGFLVADARSEYDTVWGVVEEFLVFFVSWIHRSNLIPAIRCPAPILVTAQVCTMNEAAKSSDTVFHHDT